MNSLPLTLAQTAGPLERMIFRNPGASDLAHQTDKIFLWILYFCIFWFVVLMGLMVFWVVKYRRRPGVPAQRSAHHNAPLELVWTIVPSVFLGAMFYFGFRGYVSKLVAPSNAEVINVTGQRWDWIITYGNGVNPQEKTEVGGNQSAPIILVPVGRPVQFRMTSIDVLHSFWIPDFRFKFDVMPNRYTSFWIKAEEPGDHWVFCAEYCGERHSEMSAIMRAVPADEYDATLAKWFNETGNLPDWQRGQRLVQGKGGCAACHSINGAPGVGPTWKNSWGEPVKFADGSTLPGDDADAWNNYILESVKNPNAKIVAGFPSPSPMPSYAGIFTDQEIRYIAAYIESLSDKGSIKQDQGGGEAGGQQ